MKNALISGEITVRSAELDPHSIIVRDRQRKVAVEHVERLLASFAETGRQIVPIAVSEREDGSFVLIDGAHRLEAAKRDGRTTIRAEIYTGLAEDHENVLEFVTNHARRELSPAEILLAWETFDLPLYESKARDKQAVAGAITLEARGQIAESPLIPGGNKRGNDAAVTIAQAAVDRTGHKPEWLDKVRTIRDLASSEEAPAPVREAAQRGYAKLQSPTAKVEPVYKQVQKVHEAVLQEQEDPEERKLRAAEKRLDEVVRDTTLFQARMEGDIREVLQLAASQNPMSREMLRSARVALVHALTALVVVECEVDGGRGDALKRVGSEVTTLLHAQAVRQLGLEVRHA